MSTPDAMRYQVIHEMSFHGIKHQNILQLLISTHGFLQLSKHYKREIRT